MKNTQSQATVSLPSAMLRQVDNVSKREHRTRSELVREALRVYFERSRALPVDTPTEAERRAMEKGRAQILRGQYHTLNEFRTWLLGASGKKARAEKSPARPSTRARTARGRA